MPGVVETHQVRRPHRGEQLQLVGEAAVLVVAGVLVEHLHRHHVDVEAEPGRRGGLVVAAVVAPAQRLPQLVVGDAAHRLPCESPAPR